MLVGMSGWGDEAPPRRRLYVYRAAVFGVTSLVILGFALNIAVGSLVRGHNVGTSLVTAVIMLVIASFTVFRAALAWREHRNLRTDHPRHSP